MSEFAPLYQRIARHAEARPEALAVAFGKSRLNYAELAGRIAGAARALQREGLVPGDRVLLRAANSIELVIAYFALHAAGAVACPVPPETPSTIVDSLLERTGARLMLVDDEGAAGPSLPISFTHETAAEPPAVQARPDTPADILFTSGTTGQRKGVILTHGNIAAAAENISAFIGNASSDHEALPLPLSHSFGLGRVRCMAHVGNSILLTKGLADVPGLFRQMVAQGATGLALVPAGIEILRRTLGDYLAKLADNLTYVELGSAALQPEARDWLRRMLPRTRICHHYGLTEASRAAFLDWGDPAAPNGAVGKPSPGVTIEAVDEAGRALGAGEAGELRIRGAVVASGYLDDPELTRERMTAAGFRSGDMGFVDAQGYVHLIGRKDDVINVGGKKVAPEEVEAALIEHPAVLEAACVGRPDELMGQVVTAYVVPRHEVDPEELSRHLAARLERHKQPAGYSFVDALPRTASGKLQRFLLRTNEA